ncbi:MAG: aminotransferase class I/II-fold pyridoxal phosphate-dependent enzyme [Lachnospiraceae bacterium]|nr:aminotransferase class I/II-fold pyridoxal phosphate-dependent enzyme [Lachnospiraceae bacterium]
MSGWRDNLLKVEPYVPGDQPNEPDMIKLNTNENPFPPAPGVKKVLEDMKYDRLRLYPPTDAGRLTDSLARAYNIDRDRIFVGVGSDDVLGMAFLACFAGKKEILFPDITYSFYSVWADLFKIPYKRPALDENFRIKKEDYYAPNGGVVIANPNAPTSLAMPLGDIEDIIRHNPDSVVIVDEAYIDFGGESARPLLEKYDNLLVVQTFSKSRSMAGMRIGFALGSKELIKEIYSVRNSYNSYTMSMVSILCGAAAVDDDAYFKKTVSEVVGIRNYTRSRLLELGYDVLESATNFLFVEHPEISAKDIFEKLKKKHIYVRYFNAPRINNRIRMSMGTKEEMDKVLLEFERIAKGE